MAKGRNTFEAYQQEKQARREALIADYLGYLRTTRVKFIFVTDLAQMVAKYIAQQEQGECNKATLLRNKRYKALLLTFMVSHQGGGSRAPALLDVADDRARAQIATLQLETSNLRRDNERLRAHVASMEREAAAAGKTASAASDGSGSIDLSVQLLDVHMKYVRSCQALQMVMNHMERALAMDLEKHCIIDRSRLRNNVVVEASLAAPFFEWLVGNKNIG